MRPGLIGVTLLLATMGAWAQTQTCVPGQITIIPSSLPGGTVNQFYSQTLTNSASGSDLNSARR